MDWNQIIVLIQGQYQSPVFIRIVISFCAFLTYLIVRRYFFSRLIKDKNIKKKDRKLSTQKINRTLNIVLLIFVGIVWFSVLQTVFVSMLAFVAAIVIATKEIIMCITGGILVKINHQFALGDKILVDGIRGYVTYKSLTVTKILEVGPEKTSQQTTGNIVAIPNSLFLTKSLYNESYFKGYSIRSFLFNVDKDDSLERLEELLLGKAMEISSEYLDSAKKEITNFCDREGIEISSIDPKTKISINEKNDVSIILKMPVKNNQIANVEQVLLRYYLEIKV